MTEQKKDHPKYQTGSTPGLLLHLLGKMNEAMDVKLPESIYCTRGT